MARLLIVVVLTLSAACQGGTVDRTFVGTFRLVTRDGQPLPAPIPVTYHNQPCQMDLLSSTLVIRSSGTWSETVTAQTRCGPNGSEAQPSFTAKEGGNTNLDAENPGRLLLGSREMDEAGTTQVAYLVGDELHMTVSDPRVIARTFVYQRAK